ncbi:hypothetical protein RhiirA5_506696 [Rhizophagus irregularis]|uniref:Uncharacterized protein n=1 Tax=Rhizophagus irregularis TaxID=588596 RepID=A0A2N0NRM2_9GLOM|nr:hypothetical protein RhiirA5_506696 [Rhizophagus irregularis]
MSTSKQTSEQYPGYETITSYLKERENCQENWTYYGLLLLHQIYWKEVITELNKSLVQKEKYNDFAKKISKYFTKDPVDEHIHIIISLPETANKAFNWVANRPLKDLKETIFSLYQFPELEKNGATLTFSCNEKQYSPQIYLEFLNMLQLFVLKRSSKFTVFIETSLSFSSWTFPKECQLYKLSEDSNPLLSVFSLFNCGFVDLDDEKSQEMKYQKVKYVCSYLVAIDNLLEDKFKICPEKNVSDLNGYGPIDFQQGVAQNAVQYESALSNNKKKVFGIITNSESFFWNVHYDSKLKGITMINTQDNKLKVHVRDKIIPSSNYNIQKGNLVDYINPLLALQRKSSKDNHTKCSGTTTTEITKNVNNNNLQVNTDLQPSYDNSSPSPSLLVQKPLTEEVINKKQIDENETLTS